MENKISILANIGIISASVLSTNINSLVQIKKNNINALDYTQGKKIDINIKPRHAYGASGFFELINYGKDGCNSFDDYVKKHSVYSDPSYYLVGQIGNGERWHIEKNWLAEPVETSYIKDRVEENNLINVINLTWTSENSHRKTTLEVNEAFKDSKANKTIYIFWGYDAINNNHIDDVKFQAYL